MLMRSTRTETEIERSHLKSLLCVFATFVIANVVLFIGFTHGAAAQTKSADAATRLAHMLAAPEITPNLSQTSVAVVMSIGFAIMLVGSLTFLRTLANDMAPQKRTP